MELGPRHQCLVYAGAPSRYLPALAAIMSDRLKQNYRCLYLNSPPMVAGMRSYLAARGLDVAYEAAETNLVLSSDQGHLVDGRFDVERMLDMLEDAVETALADGYAGLWASGDMTWEFGPDRDFTKLMDYEWRLEEFFRARPELSGVCQYCTDTLPREATREGLLVHPSIFVNETLSRINPHYVRRELFTPDALRNPELEHLIAWCCAAEGAN